MGATGGYEPTPASEDLASLLQDLPAGVHIAVTLRGLEIGTRCRSAGRRPTTAATASS